MEKKDRAALRRALAKRITEIDAVSKDLIEQYLDSRERLDEAKYDDDSAAISTELANMARILSMLGVSQRSKRRDELEDAIREQLKAKSLSGAVFEDKVNQFLSLWDAFQDANESLNTRGRSYITISSSGKEYEKDNSATRDIVSLAKAMQDLLDDLEITVNGYTSPDDDEL